MITEPAASEDDLDLRHYLYVLLRHKWTVAATIGVVVAFGLGASVLQTPIYQGEARVLLQADPSESVFNSETGERNDPGRAVPTEIQIIKSRPVRELVRKVLDPVPPVSASGVGDDTDVISIKVRNPSASAAAKAANTFAEKYLEFKETSAVASLVQATTELSKQIANLQSQVNALDARIAAERAESTTDLRAQRDGLIQQVGTFRQQLEQLQLQSRLKEGGAQIIEPAEAGGSPVSPRPLRNALLALAIGSLLGVGLALLREQLDDSIRSKEDVEFVSKLPVLALIPNSTRTREGGVVSLLEPNSGPAEAYRGLRTAVQFANLDGGARIIQMTSPSQGEGKTTTLGNLAIALASAGTSVIVVCCDLRRPRVHELFGMSNSVGFTSVLLGNTKLENALQPVPGAGRVQMLASGPPPPNPSELLSHPRTGQLLKELQHRADVILIDSPPVLPVTDSLVLSRWTDSVIVVASATQTSKKALSRSLELLDQVNAPIIGTVLNGVTDGPGYGYGYGYGYGSTGSSTPADNGKRTNAPGPAKPASKVGASRRAKSGRHRRR